MPHCPTTHQMFTHTRFFDFSRFFNSSPSRNFQSRVRSAFEPSKPRHRLLRFALGLAGLALVVVLVMVGVVLGATMLAVGLVYKLVNKLVNPLSARRGKPVARDARIVDAEYRVVAKPLLTR